MISKDRQAVYLDLKKGGRRIGVELKASVASSVTVGFWNSFDALELETAYVVAPVHSGYPLRDNVRVIPIADLDSLALLGGC